MAKWLPALAVLLLAAGAAAQMTLCVQHEDDCAYCSPRGDACMRCAAGYTLEYGWCEPCSAPGTGKATRLSCATCVGLKRSQSCSSCMRDWDPETVGLGSFVDAKGACRPTADKNCAQAENGTGACVRCASGFRMAAGACQPCASRGCADCSQGASVCSACAEGFKLEGIACKPSACPHGKFLDQATGKCSDVCLVTACDACTPGDNRSCERCWPGHNQVLSAAGVRHKCLKPLGKAKAPKA